MVEQWPFKPWVGGSNPPTLILLLLLCGLAGAEDAALENARAAADALAAGKTAEAAAGCGKLLTFDLPPEQWLDANFALLCLRPQDLKKLLDRVPRRPWMEFEDDTRMSDLVRRARRDPTGTAKVIEDRLAKTPDDPLLVNLLGSIYEALGRTDDATARYEKAAKLAGKATCFWINFPQIALAGILREKGRLDDAYLLEREVITWLSDLPDPRVPLSKGDLAAGIRALRDAAYYRTQLAIALSNSGYYQEQQGHHQAAIEAYRKSLEIEPRDAQTQGNLAAAQYAIGDYAAALVAIKAALALDPKNDIFQKEKQIIEASLNEGK